MPSRFFVFISPPVAAPGLELREGLNILSENGFAMLQQLAPDSFLLDHIEAEDGSRIPRSDAPALVPPPVPADAGELVPDAGEPVSAAADVEGEAEGEALGEAEREGPAIGPDAVTPAAGIKRPRARKS